MGSIGSSLLTWVRPVIRILRRKTVLALIFCLSFAYCMTSLYYGHHYRNVTNMGMGSIRGAIMSDYAEIDDGTGGNIGFRRGAVGSKINDNGNHGNGAAIGMIPLLSPGLDSHDRRVMQNIDNFIDYPNAGDQTDNPAVAAAVDENRITSCRNSVQGKVLIADDRGYICQRKELLMSTGCCDSPSSNSKDKRYSCETCNSESNCCSIYEYCISCCMHPKHKGLLSAVVHGNDGNDNSIRSPVSQVFYASLTDQFDYCLARCRTSSHSVQHENSYRDPKAKHCFGAMDPPVPAAVAVSPDPT